MQKQIIATGNFANIKKYIGAGYLPVSIARFNRYFSGVTMKELAPHVDFMKSPESEYIPLYEKRVLAQQDARQVVNRLAKLGEKVVLLCYESEGEFCHRRLVADWIKRETGISVPELGRMRPLINEEKKKLKTEKLF